MKTITAKELQALENHQEKLKYKNLYMELVNAFRGIRQDEGTIVSAAYVMYLWKNSNDSSKNKKDCFKCIEDENIRYYAQDHLNQFVEQLKNLSLKYNNEDLLYLIFFCKLSDTFRSDMSTPDGVCLLAKELLDIKDKDFVADFGTGAGGFILSVYQDHPNARLLANELSMPFMIIARIKCALLGANIELDQNDMFNYYNSEYTFDKIFCDHPIGISLNNFRITALREKMCGEILGNTKIISGDWLYNYLLLNCLKKNGKAVTLMTAGSTFNMGDQAAREYYVNNGLIETIIDLPPNLFPWTGVNFVLVVLSRGNKNIRMINARDIFHKGRRINTLTKEDVDAILNIGESSKISKFVSQKKIADNAYSLYPAKYLMEVKPVINGIKFENLVKNIRRGAHLTAAELDKLSTTKKTNCQYLMLANIENGVINDELPYLKEIPAADERYCLQTGEIVLSKIGHQFKVAMAQVEKGKKIIANGNLYIIEVNEEKVNPYYVLAYLNSDAGMAALDMLVTGSTIPSISLASLKTLPIPMVSEEKQDSIVKTYLAKLDELALLKIKIEKTKASLKNIFDKEGC